MADGTTLSPGSGGDKMQTLDDGAKKWPTAVATYAVSLADGANALQPVTTSHGLPVSQQGVFVVQPGDTPNATPWLMSINAGGNTAAVDASGRLTVNAVQSGSWTIDVGPISTITTVDAVTSITDPVKVYQDTPGDLLATVNIASAQTLAAVTSITNPVTVQQSTPGNLLCTANIASGQTLANVTNVGTVGAIAGAVTVSQATASSLNATVAIAAAQTLANVTTLGSITNAVTVQQATPGNLLATVSIASAQTLANVTTVGSITNPVTVTQGTAANLNATVSIAAAQTLANVTNVGTLGSITNAVTVSQGTAANLNATVSLAPAQTLANVTTLGSITNAVTVSQPTASSLNATAVLAAGTNLVGKASAGADTATIYNGTTALTPKFAKISASSSGDNTVVALVAGKKIRVLEWGLAASGTVGIKWRSNTTDLTGVRPMIQYASAGGSYSPIGRFETAAGEALVLNLSAAVPVGGDLAYIEV